MNTFEPLASRMRPRTLDEFLGQSHLIAPNRALYQAISMGSLHSMIFWGPPGTGKTTLAHIIAHTTEAEFESISAVLAGVKDIRAAVVRAKQNQADNNRKTVLFVDEVHRFNKAQQDAFLPHLEDGTIILIGATTENPSFELNNALLSRARVYVLKSLKHDDLLALINTTLADEDRGLGQLNLTLSESHKKIIIQVTDGDARRVLNILEVVSDLLEPGDALTDELLQEVLANSTRRFDKGGDIFYEQISALHKSVRGTDPDAALYWLCRMLEAGCDPHYIARRVVRMAYEDIGNADPRALEIALNAWHAYERLGSPEGELAIAQAIVYLACAAKSNAVYSAFNAAMQDAKQNGSLDVPMHLRNAPTTMMKSMGYGKNYRYAHNEADAYAKGEKYFPDAMSETQYYHPVDRGLELKIKEKLNRLKSR